MTEENLEKMCGDLGKQLKSGLYECATNNQKGCSSRVPIGEDFVYCTRYNNPQKYDRKD